MPCLPKMPVTVLLVLLLCSCAAPTAAPANAPTTAPAAEITVFAAASLTQAFKEIGQEFEAANTNVSVVFNFAGSDKLAQQINQGAPTDVFASANAKQMDVVVQAGGVSAEQVKPFVRNRLAVIFPADNPAQIASLADLAKPGIKLVLANKSVPVGSYSLDVFAKASQLPEYTASYSPTVLANVVSYEENVKAVLSKVVLGEADAGIVYTSDIVRDSVDKIGRLEIPDALNTLATYPIAATTGAKQPALAEAFVEYVLSPAGQQILRDYGFIPVGAKS